MIILTRDMMDQVELTKNEQDFTWTDAGCIAAIARITLGTLMANQVNFEREYQKAFDDDAVAKIDAMIEEDLE